MMKKYTTCQIKGEWDDIKKFQSLFLLRVPCSLLAKCLVQILTSFALTGPVGSTVHASCSMFHLDPAYAT